MFNDAVNILRSELKFDKSVGTADRSYKIIDVNVFKSYVSKKGKIYV
jgi:hypothetical protein